MNEQKAKCEAVEKRESERRQVEEKKHNEEIQFLKRTNQQLKVIVAPAQMECPQPQPLPLPLPLPLLAKQSSPSILSYTDFQYCQGVKEALLGRGEGSECRFSVHLVLEMGSVLTSEPP